MGFIKTMLWPFFQGKPAQAPGPTGPTGPHSYALPAGPTGPTGPSGPREFGSTGPIGITGPIRGGSNDLVPFGPVTKPLLPRAPEAVPLFQPLVTNNDRARIFGKFDYYAQPLPGNAEHVHIVGGWVDENIIWVDIPQLKNKLGVTTGAVSHQPGMLFHKLGAKQLQGMFRDWETAGLIDRILSFDGSFVPRFVRGSRLTLSNHCFGNAFDINCNFNEMGSSPAAIGQRGSVRELVPIATKWGFYWGGFYHTRPDGMHFELSVVQ